MFSNAADKDKGIFPNIKIEQIHWKTSDYSKIETEGTQDCNCGAYQIFMTYDDVKTDDVKAGETIGDKNLFEHLNYTDKPELCLKYEECDTNILYHINSKCFKEKQEETKQEICSKLYNQGKDCENTIKYQNKISGNEVKNIIEVGKNMALGKNIMVDACFIPPGTYSKQKKHEIDIFNVQNKLSAPGLNDTKTPNRLTNITNKQNRRPSKTGIYRFYSKTQTNNLSSTDIVINNSIDKVNQISTDSISNYNKDIQNQKTPIPSHNKTLNENAFRSVNNKFKSAKNSKKSNRISLNQSTLK